MLKFSMFTKSIIAISFPLLCWLIHKAGQLARLYRLSEKKAALHRRLAPDEDKRYLVLVNRCGSDWQAEIEIAETLRHHPFLTRASAIEEILHRQPAHQ